MKQFLTVVLLTVLILTGCSKENKESTGHGQTAATDSTRYALTFLEVGSTTCIPCKQMVPVMEKVESEYAGRVKVIFHDVKTDAGQEVVSQYGVQLIPTQIFVNAQGEEVYRHQGYIDFEALSEEIETQLKAAGE